MFSGWGKSKPNTPGELALELSKEPDSPKSSTPKEGGGGGGAGSVHGFDPSALERAAKAAKDLDKSKNSKEALQLISTQEATRQKEHEMERAKYMAMQQELAIRKVQEEEVAAARTMEKKTEHDKQLADYKDQLERRRLVEQLNAQKQLQEEERMKAEESLQRQEAIRRKTLEYEAELRQQTEMARVKAETEGRIKQERSNHDLTIENKRIEAQEFRSTVLEGIKLAGTTIGNGLQDFLTDRTKLLNTATTVSAIVFGIYFAKVSTSVAGRFIEARLGKPSLVRETTRKSAIQMIRSPITSFRLAFGSAQGENALRNIVLAPGLDQRLRRVSTSTANTKKNNAPFRHLLLHGPPGTGKTMFAKGLARESGLHYAIMTGGDIAPLGKDAVTEIHKLFDWANTTNKGVLLFVDEADAFLRKRSTETISEDVRNALNAFLYRTGEASHKFMVVYASNQPDQFDWAINDRIDEMVEFRLPGYDERLRMITQYMDQYLLHPPSSSRPITVTGVDEDILRTVAGKTEGFSGREISKLAIAWQAAAYGTENATLSAELLLQILDENMETKYKKKLWLSHDEIINMTVDSQAEAKQNKSK